MKNLLIATSNLGKFKEFESLLSPVFVCEPLPPKTPAPIEDGNTYRENAKKKAEAYFTIFRKPVLADDSGLEVDALGGAPGVDSADFGGEQISWQQRWDYLYQQLKKVEATQSPARFRCVLCYFDGIDKPHFFEATTEGYIASSPSGNQGFGYDPIFYSTDLLKTLGEASSAEKGRISHRARATQRFLDWFNNNVS